MKCEKCEQNTGSKEIDDFPARRLRDGDVEICFALGLVIMIVFGMALFVVSTNLIFSLVFPFVLAASSGLMFAYLQAGFPSAWRGLQHSVLGASLGLAGLLVGYALAA